MRLINLLTSRSIFAILLPMLAGTIAGLSSTGIIATITKSIGQTKNLPELTLVFVVLCILHVATKYISSVAILRLSQSAVYRMQVDISRRLLATPQQILQKLGKHRLLAILTADISTLTQCFHVLPIAFTHAITIVTCLSYMAFVSWKSFLLLTVFLCIALLVFRLAERFPERHLAALREKTDHVLDNFRNLIEGSRELQLNSERGTLFIEEVLVPDTSEFKQVRIKGLTGYILLLNIGTALFLISIGGVLFLMPSWSNSTALSTGTVALIALYMISPIGELMNVMPALREGNISLKKIHQLNSELLPQDSLQQNHDIFLKENAISLQFRDIRYNYHNHSEDSNFTLGPIDLTVDKGEIIYIVGGNGTGKTTLAMLLLGLYAPDSGSILLNDHIVNDTNRSAYRQNFSAVFSDFHLFDKLLLINRPDLVEEANHYVDKLGLSHKVSVSKGRFSTTKLSTGQRKRLALISAFLEDRPFYLFDEWAADQDPEFKRVFYTELLPSLKAAGKAVIVITHDDAYFGLADRLLKIDEGQLRPTLTAAKDERSIQLRAEEKMQ